MDRNRRQFGFGYTRYFENLDVCEAAAHEFTEGMVECGTQAAQSGSPSVAPAHRRPVRSRRPPGEPLSLWVEALTVAVIEAPAVDQLFAHMVNVNDEGAAISTEVGRPTVGVAFTSGARERLRSEPLFPIARACIELAWQHRHPLLAR